MSEHQPQPVDLAYPHCEYSQHKLNGCRLPRDTWALEYAALFNVETGRALAHPTEIYRYGVTAAICVHEMNVTNPASPGFLVIFRRKGADTSVYCPTRGHLLELLLKHGPAWVTVAAD